MTSLMASFPYIVEVASEHGPDIDRIIALLHWLMAVLFVGWMGFFLFVLFRFRSGANPTADYAGVKSHMSSYIEGAVVVAEAVLLIAFSIPLWAERMDHFPAEEESVQVRVQAEQFVWNVQYPGADGVFGRLGTEFINLETNPMGLDPDDPSGKDDITTINQLYLPVDKPVIIELTSKDVIHSFNQPHMRVKQDVIPGLRIPMWFVPTVTTEEMRAKTGNPEFQYEIACAQLCGLGHYRMRGFMTIQTQQEFDAWLAAEAELLTGDDEDSFWE